MAISTIRRGSVLFEQNKMPTSTTNTESDLGTATVSGENFWALAKKCIFCEGSVDYGYSTRSKIHTDAASADEAPKTTQMSGEDFLALTRKCVFL